MNFKDWEKVSEDGKTVTLQHPKGHQMTIAVKGLPKIQQEALKRLKLADGGQIKKQPWDESVKDTPEYDIRRELKKQKALEAEIARLKAGRSQKLAHGGDVLESGSNQGESTQGELVRETRRLNHPLRRDRKQDERISAMHQATQEAKGRVAMERTVKPKMKGLAEGGRVNYDEGADPVSTDDQSQAPAPSAQPPVVVNVNGAPQGQANPQAPAPMPAVSRAPPTDAPPVKMTPPKQVNGSSLGNEAGQNLQEVENAKAAMQDQVGVESSKAAANLPAQDELLKSQQALAQSYQQNRNAMNTHSQEFADYMKTHEINPKSYQQNMQSGAKTATTIGLLLGGLGSAFGGHNFAFDHLEKQIDRDIDAQKRNQEGAKTVLGAWQQLYGDNVIADNLAKASMNDIYATKLQRTALQLATPQAKINAAQGIQALNQKTEELRNSAASLAAHGQMSGQAPGKAPIQGAPPVQGVPGQPGAANGNNHPSFSQTILGPGAEGKFAAAQYHPILKGKLPELEKQYQGAQQADTALGHINETFMRMSKNANDSGDSGWLRRRVSPHVLGGVGAGIGAGVGLMGMGVGALPAAAIGGALGEGLGKATDAVTDTDENRAYDSGQTELKGYLSSALANTTVGGGAAIDDIVSKNSPEYGDSRKTQAHKLKAIRDFIVEHTPHDLLDLAKMSKHK